MRMKLKTAPAVEPISLTELKRHLRSLSVAFDESLAMTQTIAPGSHAIAANYSLTGSSVDVSGSEVMVILESGPNGTGGTVNVKLQESSDDSTWTDVSDGDFEQVTTANDNTTYELLYTGRLQYIRAVATVAGAVCDFGVSIVEGAVYTTEDAHLALLITAARKHVENRTGRALITQTWQTYLDGWPSSMDDDSTVIMLPRPPLKTVSSVKYTDYAGTESTFAATNYDVDTISEPGLIRLGYGKSWAGATLRPTNPIVIEHICGYGDAGSDVPEDIRIFIMMLAGSMYENRETEIIGATVNELKFAEHLLDNYRIGMIV